MIDYEIRFVRYRDGMNREMTEFIQAEDIEHAFRIGRMMIRAMRSVDTTSDYRIGMVSERGSRIHETASIGWMTSEEFAESEKDAVSP